MKRRSHSRTSYLFDKMLPQSVFTLNKSQFPSDYKRSSASMAVDKAMHKKKQREHDRKLARQEHASYYTKF